MEKGFGVSNLFMGASTTPVCISLYLVRFAFKCVSELYVCV